jgi:hypothetical protein
MANLKDTTVAGDLQITGDLSVTGSSSGQGLVPVGAILPVVSALTGSHTIPSSGVVDADGWQYCDGAVIPSSQTLEGTTPNLTDGRFLRGFTSSSGCGGSATFTLALGNLAAHDHGGATTSASTTPGAGSACAATTGACAATTGNFSANHTHTFTTGAQNCQHCHCICDGGTHLHSTSSWRNCCSAGGNHQGSQLCCTLSRNSDSRQHCATHTCCTYGSTTHLHSGTTATVSANHTHAIASHDHTIPSHTHTGAAHTHTTTVASAGSGTAKSHIPIYFNVKYLIRVI